jgi:hypothetical protein
MQVEAAPESRAFVSGSVTAWTEGNNSEAYLTEAWKRVVIVGCDFREGGC